MSLSVDDLEIRDLRRGEGTLPQVRTMVIDNDQDLDMRLEGKGCDITAATGFSMDSGNIGELHLREKEIVDRY